MSASPLDAAAQVLHVAIHELRGLMRDMGDRRLRVRLIALECRLLHEEATLRRAAERMAKRSGGA